MSKILFCVMDSTTSKYLPGWDVEIFNDTQKVRIAWVKSAVGTDDETMREEFNKELSVFGLISEEEANKYVEKLKEKYETYDITKIPQIEEVDLSDMDRKEKEEYLIEILQKYGFLKDVEKFKYDLVKLSDENIDKKIETARYVCLLKVIRTNV